jgi:predicted O-methyltransferase YrrM
VSQDAIPRQLQSYLDGLVPRRHDVLLAMEEKAHVEGFPIIGPACGLFCYQVARLTGARRIFELGSGFGYSTAWFAQAVRENGGGLVHHTVWDQDLSAQARGYLGALGMSELVRFHVSEAVDALRRQTQSFDLIFNDIDKEAYPESLPVIETRLRPGGVLIVDNLLWGNRIFDASERDAATEGIRELTRRIAGSGRWVSSILPIRDGLLLAYKSASSRETGRSGVFA